MTTTFRPDSSALVDHAVDAAPAVICAVRDFDRDAVADVLGPMDVLELRALVVILAAAIDPDDLSLPHALRWVDGDEPAGPAWWTTTEQARHRQALMDAISGRDC